VRIFCLINRIKRFVKETSLQCQFPFGLTAAILNPRAHFEETASVVNLHGSMREKLRFNEGVAQVQ